MKHKLNIVAIKQLKSQVAQLREQLKPQDEKYSIWDFIAEDVPSPPEGWEPPLWFIECAERQKEEQEDKRTCYQRMIEMVLNNQVPKED